MNLDQLKVACNSDLKRLRALESKEKEYNGLESAVKAALEAKEILLITPQSANYQRIRELCNLVGFKNDMDQLPELRQLLLRAGHRGVMAKFGTIELQHQKDLLDVLATSEWGQYSIWIKCA